MEDDFNTPKAIAAIFELIAKGNYLIDKKLLGRADARNILEFLKKIDRFFNFIFWPKIKEKIPEAVLSLAKLREEYRKEKNWQKADEIRQEIKKEGYWVEDTKEGPLLKKKD